MRLIRASGETITPSDDGKLFEKIFTDGLFADATFSVSGGAISLPACKGIMCGRDFSVDAATLSPDLPVGSTADGLVIVQIDLTKTAGSQLSVIGKLKPYTLTKDAINESGGTKYEMVVAEYTASNSGVTAVTAKYDLSMVIMDPDTISTIQTAITSLNSSVSGISSATILHQVTSATANLNGSAYRDYQKIYYFTTSTTISNGPSGVVDGWMIVLPTTQSTKQIFLRYGTVGANDSEIYVRTFKKSTTTWSPWSRLSVYSRSRDIQIDLQTGWSKSWGGKGVYYIEVNSGFTEIASVSIAWIEHAPKLVVPYFDKNTNKVGVLCESNSGFDKDSKAIIRVIGR